MDRSTPHSSAGARRPAVLVSDGDTRAALAVVRALGAAGFEVRVLGRRTIAGASRYAAAECAVPDASGDPAAWAAAVKGLLGTQQGDPLLVPVTEVALGTAFAYGLAPHPRVVSPAPAAYATAADKQALLARAEGAGLAVPRGVPVENREELRAAAEHFSFPLVVKPRRSWWLAQGRWCTAPVRVVRDDAALEDVARDPGLAAGVLVQEFVPGRGEGIFLLAERGEVRVRFAHRRLREKPPGGGVSVLCESVAPDPELLGPCERLLADLEWHGVAMFEFRRTPEHRALLMELNPRFWGSLQLAVDAGVSFPELLVRMWSGEPVPRLEGRPGIRVRWLLGDLDRVLTALRRPALRRELHLRALPLLAGFVRSFVDGSRGDVLRRDDPRPFLRELRAWMR